MFGPDVLLLFALLGSQATLSAPARLGAQPPRTGAETMASSCTPCHGMSLIAQQRLGADGWTREVDKMIRWGARVPEDQKQALVDYLAETFRLARPAGNVNRHLPESAGVELVRAGCLGCHDDRFIGQQPRTRGEWSQIVDRMIGWGAAIPRGRINDVVDYLTTRFGR
jgi:hypothetical protein